METKLYFTVLIASACLSGLFRLAVSDSFDYLVFTQEWPPTFCDSNHCDFPTEKVKGWNIHGLWPSSDSGKNPEYCKNGQNFDYDSLQPIFSQLQVSWADLKDFDSPKKFWKYEWEKHGRCALTDPMLGTELKYFNTSVELQKRFALEKILASKNVKPDDDNSYETYNVEMILHGIFGARVGVRCNFEGGRPMWIETRFCLDPQLKLVDCPDEDNHALRFIGGGQNLKTQPCNDELFYPTFDSIVQRKNPRFAFRTVR